MNSYPEYKDSRIDWVGEIPVHWKSIKPKYILNRVTRPIDDDDDVVTCFRDGVVTLRKNRREDGFTTSIKEHGYQQIHSGDLVVHEMDGFSGAIGISDSKGKSTPVYTVIEPDGKTDLRYIVYLLREMSKTGKIESLARSIRERTTDFRWGMWSTIDFCFPPLHEQILISKFLDKKTSQIDSLIEKTQQKILLLKEQRTSLINQCVTKGLDPNVEMKDSGIEWIGEIPKHWKVSKLKFEVDFFNNLRSPLSSEERSTRQGQYRYYGSTSVIDYIDDYNYDGEYILIAEDGGNLVLRNIRLSFIVTGKFWVNNHAHVLNTKEHVLNVYFCELLELTDYSIYISGSAQPKLTFENISNIPIIVPPNQEVKTISSRLEVISKNFMTILDKQNHRVNLLKEYRQSLISNVVTGKVRVTEDMI